MSLITNLEDQNPLLSDANDIKLWLRANEAVGIRTLTDAVNGGIFGAANTPDGDGGILLEVANNKAVSGGGIPNLTTDDWAAILVMDCDALSSFIIGHSSNSHKILYQYGTQIIIEGSTNPISFTSPNDFPAAGLGKSLIVSEKGSNTTLYSAAGGAKLTAGTPQVASTHGDLTSIDSVYNATKITGDLPTLYGFMLISFANGIPDDIIVMADWIMEQAILNNKKFYPRMTEL